MHQETIFSNIIATAQSIPNHGLLSVFVAFLGHFNLGLLAFLFNKRCRLSPARPACSYATVLMISSIYNAESEKMTVKYI